MRHEYLPYSDSLDQSAGGLFRRLQYCIVRTQSFEKHHSLGRNITNNSSKSTETSLKFCLKPYNLHSNAVALSQLCNLAITKCKDYPEVNFYSSISLKFEIACTSTISNSTLVSQPTMSSSSFDEPQFLEPAHYHDPSNISSIVAIPTALLDALPTDAQKALWDMQESTSIAFASYRRLQDLSKERFHRLVPAKHQGHDSEVVKYSEPAFQNYVNSLQAEKTYFLEEAIVDFRHKARRIDFAGQQDKKLSVDGKTTTPVKWWAALQGTVETWFDMVEDIDIPDFEETIQEFRLFQVKESRRSLARDERNRRRKTMLDLERPEFGHNKLEKFDSAVVMD